MGLYNVTQSDSAKAAEYQAMATFCAYDYSSSNISSSQSAQIEASYGLFSGGAGGSASRQEIITKQSQVCSLGFNSSKYWEKASAYSRTVYQGSLDAWNRCQELANKGMEFDVQPSSTMQGVNVAITAPSGYQAIFYGVTQHGQGRSTCKIMANGKITPISLTKPFTFDAASKVTVDCNRIMKKNGNDLSADAQDMVFVTSAKNLVVPLAAIGSFSRVTADQLRSETKAKEDQLRSETKAGDTALQEVNLAQQSLLDGIKSQTYITANCRVAASVGWDQWGSSSVQCNSDEVATGGGGNTWCAGGYGGLIHATHPYGSNGWYIDQDGGNRTCSNTYAICCKKY